MTEQNTPARHPFEPREADIAAEQRASNSDLERFDLERFLGGSPSAVLARLVFLSLIVGFFLVWIDIRPIDVLISLRHIVERFWAAGFDAIREIFEYVAAGAAIVVPLWLALRLLNMRSKT
jgi:Family of unknown function (DUF6460)